MQFFEGHSRHAHVLQIDTLAHETLEQLLVMAAAGSRGMIVKSVQRFFPHTHSSTSRMRHFVLNVLRLCVYTPPAVRRDLLNVVIDR